MKIKDTSKCSKKKKSKMLIKWTDLMPGDKLKYNPEFVKKVSKSTILYEDEKRSITKKENATLTISYVELYEEDCFIHIEFKEYGVKSWKLRLDGTSDYGLYYFNRTPVFILVSLSEEK